MSLVTQMSLVLKAIQSSTNAFGNTVTDAAVFPFNSLKWTSGTGANQADLVYHARPTISGSGSSNFDLAGSLTDQFGATIANARIKLIAIHNRAAIGSGFVLSIGGAASNPFINWVADSTDKINVRPQGLFLLAAPDATAYAVTAATGDILKIANGGGSAVDLDLILIGASA